MLRADKDGGKKNGKRNDLRKIRQMYVRRQLPSGVQTDGIISVLRAEKQQGGIQQDKACELQESQM